MTKNAPKLLATFEGIKEAVRGLGALEAEDPKLGELLRVQLLSEIAQLPADVRDPSCDLITTLDCIGELGVRLTKLTGAEYLHASGVLFTLLFGRPRGPSS